jgi:hypothetical protein
MISCFFGLFGAFEMQNHYHPQVGFFGFKYFLKPDKKMFMV